jgi:outer membrane lipoprotein carrier protein
VAVFRSFASCAFLFLSGSLFSWNQDAAAPRDHAGKTTDISVPRRFEERYRRAARLQATFLERYSENGRLIRSEAGRVYFLRPGKMRWEYESPEKNLFLVDGKTAWFYVPADHTVTRVPAKQSTDWRTPLALLAGRIKLSKICARVEYAAEQLVESRADTMLYCELRGANPKTGGAESGSRPVPKSASDGVYLEIQSNSGDLVRVLLSDPGGVGIEFRFANWQLDPQLDESLFRFQVPPGVAIVNGALPVGEER